MPRRLCPTSSKLLLAAACGAALVACGGDVLQDAGHAAPSALSPHQRYIVKFTHQGARQAVEAVGGTVVLELPAHSAFAAIIPDAAVAGLAKAPGVELIEVDAVRAPSSEQTPYGVSMVQAPQSWAANATGAGVKLCIIDSGLDTSHEDFAGINVTGDNDDGGTGSFSNDQCGHGTHVAGTIAAAANGVGVVGVARPDLHIVKVFGDGSTPGDCGWAYSSSLVAALEKCEAAGAKVVSMSLGGGLKSKFEEWAFADADARGVLSIAAAGNDGNTRKSYPASYPSVVSVAAIDSTETVAGFSQQNDQVELAAPGVGVLSTVPVGTGRDAATTVDATSYTTEGMEGSPLGSASGALVDCGLGASAADCGDATGKICLIERGSYNFSQKVLSCQDAGGVGAIIYNNVPGLFGGTMAGVVTTIPSVSMSQEDGQLLKATALGATAAISLTPSNYGHKDGTSMATPHVSAVAALVWSAHPAWTNQEVRAAMTATAKDLPPAGKDNASGYGLVQAYDAINYTPGGGGTGGAGGTGGTGGDTGGTGGTGSGGTGGGAICSPKGASCSTGSECCSGACHPRRGTCN